MEEDLEEGMVEDLGSNDRRRKDNIRPGLEDHSSTMGLLHHSSSSTMGRLLSNNSSMISIKRAMTMATTTMGTETVMTRAMIVNTTIITDEEDLHRTKATRSKIITTQDRMDPRVLTDLMVMEGADHQCEAEEADL